MFVNDVNFLLTLMKRGSI